MADDTNRGTGESVASLESQSGHQQLRHRFQGKHKMVPHIVSPHLIDSQPAASTSSVGGAKQTGSSPSQSYHSEMKQLGDRHTTTTRTENSDYNHHHTDTRHRFDLSSPVTSSLDGSGHAKSAHSSSSSPARNSASHSGGKANGRKPVNKGYRSPSNRDATRNEAYELDDLTQPLLEDSEDMADVGDVELQTSASDARLTDQDTSVELVGKDAEYIKAQNEPSWSICIQVFIPFLIAGLGMVGAGMVLDIVQHWDVFVNVSEVFILVPALLGLKGNLEMTLASRLSTQANIGNMDTYEEQWKMISGNIALTQAQAIVVGFLASCAAMIFGWIPQGKFNLQHGLLLCASSVLTAAIASLVLGSIMVVVVLLSRKCKINPDNVATPIAASLGDLTTLALLAGISHGLYNAIDKQVWIAPVLLSIFLLLVPVWCYVSLRNHYVADVIYTGWTPVICAMVISSIGGLILDFTVSNYSGIAVFQPVINGVGGNLVAVQASRLSTALHRLSTPGVLPEGYRSGCPNLCSTYFGKGLEPRTVRVLILLVIPGHLIFMYAISYMKAGHTSITLPFALVYLSAALIQVVLLLYISNWMVHYLWRKGDDPDNCAIPYLTALGDLLGTGLLAIAFHILYVIGDRDTDVGD